MPVVVALLRGINVGGHNKVKMAELRALCDTLGLVNPRSVLQSGNLVFETESTDLESVRLRLESGIRDAFGFDVVVIARSEDAVKSIFQRHHFCAAQLDNPAKAAVAFLSDAPRSDAVEDLCENNPGSELIQADDHELFIYYTDGMARSKLDTKRIETTLGLKSTTRNWNTSNRLLKLLG